MSDDVVLSIDSNVNQFLKKIKEIHDSQIPFAMKEAVNATAFICRDVLMMDYSRVFNERNPNLKKLIRIEKADKKLTMARIYFDKMWMANNVYGGEKDAKPGRDIPIPQEVVYDQGMKGDGKILRKYYVTAQLAAADKADNRKKRLRHTAHGDKMYTEYKRQIRESNNQYQSFLLTSKEHPGAIYLARHVVGNKDDLEWLYAMYPKVKMDKKWDWDKVVPITFDFHIEQEFLKAYDSALKSEKK